jgi:hypothetical protein
MTNKKFKTICCEAQGSVVFEIYKLLNQIPEHPMHGVCDETLMDFLQGKAFEFVQKMLSTETSNELIEFHFNTHLNKN